jgi:multidrug efflux pump subunit AcrB
MKFFLERRTLFWSLMAGIIVMGILSYRSMPKLEDPAVAIKQASVIVMYPGADAHRVELDVAQVMEDNLRTLPDVKKIKTECIDGRATFNVEFLRETPMTEIEQHFDMLRRKVNDTKPKLPQGCMDPVVIDDMMDVYGIFYAFTGDGYEYSELEKYAKLIRRELLTVKGVKRINIGGTRSEMIDIEFSAEALARNGLMPTMIAQALQSSTKCIDAGKIEQGEDRLSVDVTEGAATVDEIRNILIDTPEGKKVRLGELAKVSRVYTSPQTSGLFVNGRPALSIMVTLEKSAIVPDVGKAVDAKLAEVLNRVPAGMTTEKVFFQPDQVTDAINSFMLNLLESVLIVVLLLIFSMGWRSGVIIGLGLVLTVALSFPLLSQVGTTLQRMSLGAFIVAMGMLVDNAVVIMDGILVDRQRGLPRDKYLFRIGKNTAMPLLGATIIAAATFLPIYMSPGSTGEFAGDLFLVICISLLVSWVLALIQVPVCADQFLSKRINATGNIPGEAPRENKIQAFIKKMMTWMISHKLISISTAVVLLVVSMTAMKNVRNVFFPDFNYRQFVVECYFPTESNPEAVRDRMLAINDSILAIDGVERVTMSMGGAPGRYCFVRPMPSGGENYAEFIVDCTDFKTMKSQSVKVLDYVRRLEPDAYVRFRKYNFSISTTHTVEVEFGGPDPAVLRQLSGQAEDIMRSSEYVDNYSVQNNWRPTGHELVVNFSQEAATRAGVTRADVGNALRAATDGYSVGVVNDGDKILPVKITMRDDDGSRIADPSRIPVWSMLNINLDEAPSIETLMGGASSAVNSMFRTTNLAAVTDSTSHGWREHSIVRLNGKRVIEAECDPDPHNPDATPAKVLADITPKINAINLPTGYSMRYVGEGETSGEAIEALLSYVPAMMMIVFGVLLLLFNSWKKLTAILLCFPFVFCGIVPALLISGTPFTFIAILGFMGLIGMMIKNAIVLIDEITRQINEEHQHPYNAVIIATLSRVRPVLLASMTTIVGMIPLISDAMYSSLAVTIIGGLFMGTIITLLLLPLFYSLFYKVKKPLDNTERENQK